MAAQCNEHQARRRLQLRLGDTRLQIHQNTFPRWPRTVAGNGIQVACVASVHQRTTPSLRKFGRALEQQISVCATCYNNAGKPEWHKRYRSKAANNFARSVTILLIPTTEGGECRGGSPRMDEFEAITAEEWASRGSELLDAWIR